MSQTTTRDRTQSAFSGQQAEATRQRNREEMQTGVVAVLDKQRQKFEATLPNTIDWDEFRACFLTAVQRNWRLLEADRDSLWLALQDCANMGLRPDGKEAALVIFGDDEEDEAGNRTPSRANQKKKVQLLPMVWGVCRLVMNTGLVSDIRARCVYAGETFRHWEEDGQQHYEYRRIIDANFDDDPRNIIGAFAVIQFKDGGYKMDFLSRRQIERRRAVSRAKKGPWGPWYDEQSCKTVLKHLFKSAPKSRELMKVADILERDESLPTIDGERPTELHDRELPDSSREVREEFSGDARRTGQQVNRQASAVNKSGGQQSPNDAAKTQQADDPNAWRGAVDGTASDAKTASPAAGAAQDTQVPNNAPPPQAAQATPGAPADEGFVAWLVDQDGVEVNPEPYSDPEQFATALTSLCRRNPDAAADILANNEGAIQDASDASQVAADLIAGITPADKTPSDSAPPFEATVLAVPMTPNGKAPHWPNYIAEAGRILADIPTVDALNGWMAANEPTWKGKSIQAETGVARHYKTALARLGAAPAQETGPAPDTRETLVAEIDRLGVIDLRRLQSDASWRARVNGLDFPPDRDAVRQHLEARIAAGREAER